MTAGASCARCDRGRSTVEGQLCAVLRSFRPVVKACATESNRSRNCTLLIFTKISHLNTTAQPTNPLG